MDFKEWKPKHFESWHQYYKWQHRCDIAGLIITSVIVALAVYTCGG